MKIEYHIPEEMTLEGFADKHGLVMEVHKRIDPRREDETFYAFFKGSEVKYHGLLRSEFGNGRGPKEAMEDYTLKISGQVLVIDSFKEIRREIQVPKLILR